MMPQHLRENCEWLRTVKYKSGAHVWLNAESIQWLLDQETRLKDIETAHRRFRAKAAGK